MKKHPVILIILLSVSIAALAAAETLIRPRTAAAQDRNPAGFDPAVTAEPAEVLPAVATEAPEQADFGMAPGEEYQKIDWGVTTFRGNASRQNAACGSMADAADRMEILWDYRIASEDGGEGQRFSWPGQPLVVKWSIQVRERTRFLPTYEPRTAMREVIIAEDDGTIHFLDLISGEVTRGPLKTGCPMRCSLALNPAGMPYLSVGRTDGAGQPALRQFNLYDLSEMQPVDGTDGNGGIVSAALINRMTHTLVTAGMDGTLYEVDLDPYFDYQNGILRVSPQVRTAELNPGNGGFLAPVSAVSDRIYCADMSGILRCVQSRTMKTVWEKSLEDAVVSAIALDSRDSRTMLYAADTLTNRAEGSAAVYCLDAQNGAESWRRQIDVRKQDDPQAGPNGFAASPVIGKNRLDSYLYCTVTGLTPEGRKELGLTGTEDSALAAMDKDTGTIAWAYGISGYCCSSPVAVYDKEGTGRIIQCSADGKIILLDGETGTVLDTLQAEGRIEISPAVYRDVLVVASTGKDGAHVYAIRMFNELKEKSGEDQP